MSELIADVAHEFRRHKSLADRAMAALSEGEFFQRPAKHTNPIALIVKHLAGNLASRWSDFLTSDGEKPWRNRDDEFVLGSADTRANLMASWDSAWAIVFDSLSRLNDEELSRTITIRGEPHRVQQAILRSLDHTAYHIGQILYVARLIHPAGEWLTIAPGKSREHVAGYLRPPQ